MREDMIYSPWLEMGKKYKQKYFGLQWIGLTLWGIILMICLWVYDTGIIYGAAFGFFPFFICFLCSYGFYDKWKDCEHKYSRHVPFIDVKKMNVLISSLEFVPGEVICKFLRYDGMVDSITLPAEKIHILQSQDDLDTLQLRKDTNNFTQKEDWVFINIYLTAKSQQKLLALNS